MAGNECPKRNGPSICITDLPEPILRNAFVHLDEYTLCTAAQTCRLFLRLAGNPDLWPDQGLLPEDKLMLAARLCLSRALHLPPQIFKVKYDTSRSSQVPVLANFSNLKGILEDTDLDNVAVTACSGIAEQIKRAQVAIQGSEESCEEIDDPPAALFVLARPEKAALRFGLDNEAAFFAILDGLAELGWPPILGGSASESMDFESQKTARSKLLLIKHRFGSFRKQLNSNLRYSTVEHTLSPTAPLSDHMYLYLSLREGVLQCLEAAGLERQHPSVLEDWLGPLEVLEEYTTRADWDVLFTVRNFFPEALQVSQRETNIRSGLHLHLYRVLGNTVRMLQMHCSTMMYPMPRDAEVRPNWNGLMELAKCLREGKVLASESLRFTRRVEPGADAEAEPEDEAWEDQIGRVLSSSDPALVNRLRVRARLHLEMLRVMNWCFFMLGTTDYEQHKRHSIWHYSLSKI